MFPAVMSNSPSLSEEASGSSVTRVQDFGSLNPMAQTISTQQPQKIKKKRNLPGNPDPDAEVIALSPKTLMATNRFVCEICNKGFQRDQNLQLHRRGHNLPWKLKQRNSKENRKKVYVCPESTCVHHHPSRALGDLTGIKKHFCRKHGEKKWKCEKCAKVYAVQSDWKAHTKTCGTREYRCDCGTLFTRKDSFVTHRAFCDALAEESARLSANSVLTTSTNPTSQPFSLYPQNLSPSFTFSNEHHHHHHQQQQQQDQHQLPMLPIDISLNTYNTPQNPNPSRNQVHIKPEAIHIPISSSFFPDAPPPPTIHKNLLASPYENLFTDSSGHLSATALLQKAATVGHMNSTMTQMDMGNINAIPSNYLNFTWKKNDGMTRDFLGLTREQFGHGGSSGGNGHGLVLNGNVDDNNNNDIIMRNVLSFTGGLEFPTTTTPPPYERDFSLLKHRQSFGFAEPAAASDTWGNC